MSLFIPKNLDVDKLLSEHPADQIRGFKKSKLLNILHQIIIAPTVFKHVASVNGFTPIGSKHFQEIDRYYRLYLNYLISSGVIETDNYYIVGKKSRGYKLAYPYNSGIQVVNVRAKQNLIRKPSKAVLKEYHHILKWLNSGLTIDKPRVLGFLENDLNRKFRDPALIEYDFRNQCYKDPQHQFLSSLVSVESIALGNFNPHVDGTAGRLHSALTNMRSELRRFLSYNNARLISFDIVNCQPLLSLLIINPSFWVNNEDVINIYGIDYSFINNIFSSSFLSSFIMLCKTEENRIDSDIHIYTELVKSGKLYEYLEKEIFNDGKQRSRKEIKSAFFQVLYTDNRFWGQPEAEPKRRFAKLFPKTYLLLGKIKQKESNNLPVLLQKIESHIVLKVITKRIAEEDANIPLFTIHDSIVTTEQYQEVVFAIIQEELLRVFGFNPAVTRELWAAQ